MRTLLILILFVSSVFAEQTAIIDWSEKPSIVYLECPKCERMVPYLEGFNMADQVCSDCFNGDAK